MEIIKSLKEYDEFLDDVLDTPQGDKPENITQPLLGVVTESDSHSILVDDYLTTELIKKSEQEEAKFQEKVKKLQELLGVNEEQAKIFIAQTQSGSSNLSRPDLIYRRKKIGLDETIRQELVPSIIDEFNINKDSDDLKDCGLFKGSYWKIPNMIKSKNGKNAAMLAIYYNTYLRNKIQ